jgi:cob(I)alamin adenosyltransferase
VKFELIGLDDVLVLLDCKPESLHLVLTGRDARQEIIDRADLVTEMKEIKHPYQQGIKAQAGIEF